MLLLSSLHAHEQTSHSAASCTACVDHHCDGHLDQQSIQLHDCVLCQFVSMLYLCALATSAILFIRKATAYIDLGNQLCPAVHVGIITCRAPPSF